MDNKDLNNDLFAGGSISGDEKKKNKKSKKTEKVKKPGAASKKSLSANAKKAIKITTAVVLVVAILVTYMATGAVRKGFVNSVLQWTTNLTAVTVETADGDKISVPVSVYNYYFALAYNNMKNTQEAYEASGLSSLLGYDVDFSKPFSSQKTTNDDGDEVTWAQRMKEEVIENIKHVYSLYSAAVKDNDGKEPEITSSQKSEIDEALETYKGYADSYGYTLSAYLVAAMGKGVTESVFRREATRSYIADNYESSIEDEKVKVERTDEDYTEYRDKHEDEVKTVEIRIFDAQSEDDAKKFKDELAQDASNFTELAVKYAKEGFYKEYYKEDSASTFVHATRNSLSGFSLSQKDEDGDYYGLDWLFSKNRKAGDSLQYKNTVVYVTAPAEFCESSSIDVRHILVTPVEHNHAEGESDEEETEAVDATDEQWAAALNKANSIVDEFNKGDKTAESFGKLAEKYTADEGSEKTGGLYEDVYPGQMIQTFNNWCFDENRKDGDVAVVKTEVGYHIMYFDGRTETPIWKRLVQIELPTEVSLSENIADTAKAHVNLIGSCYFQRDVDIDR